MPLYTTLPSPAANTGWPLRPLMSMPLLLSEYPRIILPSVGHSHGTASSSAFAAGLLASGLLDGVAAGASALAGALAAAGEPAELIGA
ncbi:hypothetical protein JOS77_18880 [Chromobacterium haemolyticum]|nr:hypothetical protein JOS77_18880 [Chromobacterium haemolyticum]